MKKILVLAILPLILIPITIAQQRSNGSGSPYLWFPGWPTGNTLSAVGNITFDFGGIWWADGQLSSINVHVNWGDGSSYDFPSTGTLDPNYQSPTWSGLLSGPSHVYTKIGSYVFTVTLTDTNGNSAGPSTIGVYHPMTVTVSQGPSSNSFLGLGGKTPIPR